MDLSKPDQGATRSPLTIKHNSGIKIIVVGNGVSADKIQLSNNASCLLILTWVFMAMSPLWLGLGFVRGRGFNSFAG